jgi:hypothetical protein
VEYNETKERLQEFPTGPFRDEALSVFFQRLGFGVHLQQIVIVDVGVYLGAGEGFVPQQFLNRAQISPAVQQVSRKSVPESVG